MNKLLLTKESWVKIGNEMFPIGVGMLFGTLLQWMFGSYNILITIGIIFMLYLRELLRSL